MKAAALRCIHCGRVGIDHRLSHTHVRPAGQFARLPRQRPVERGCVRILYFCMLHRMFFIEIQLVRICCITGVIQRFSLVPWELEFPLLGSLMSAFLVYTTCIYTLYGNTPLGEARLGATWRSAHHTSEGFSGSGSSHGYNQALWASQAAPATAMTAARASGCVRSHASAITTCIIVLGSGFKQQIVEALRKSRPLAKPRPTPPHSIKSCRFPVAPDFLPFQNPFQNPREAATAAARGFGS